jgi:hypothetical protein
MHRRSKRRASLLAALGAICLAPAARATPTDPTLVLTKASAATGALHRVVRADGSFHAQDLAQIAYPLQILIRETTTGTGYLRFDLGDGGAAVTGTAAALADGLQAGEAAALLGGGAPAAGAEVVFLGLGRLEVTLPAGFPDGPAEIQLFVIDEGEPFLSNVMPLVLEAAP